jgi:hypothetical protein
MDGPETGGVEVASVSGYGSILGESHDGIMMTVVDEGQGATVDGRGMNTRLWGSDGMMGRSGRDYCWCLWYFWGSRRPGCGMNCEMNDAWIIGRLPQILKFLVVCEVSTPPNDALTVYLRCANARFKYLMFNMND